MRHSDHAKFKPSSGGAGCRTAMVRRVAPTTPTPRWAQPACTWGKRAWVRHPPFFGRLGGISLGPQSAGSPLQQEVAPRRWRYMGRPTPAPVPREGAVTVSARPGRLPETVPTVGGRRPDVLLPTHPPSGACATRLGPVPPPNPRFIQSEGGGPGAVSSLFRNPLGGTGDSGGGAAVRSSAPPCWRPNYLFG